MGAKHKIDLPQKDNEGNTYISNSQKDKWIKSKKEYIRSYFFREAFKGNAYTDFGSLVGKALEDNDFKDFSNRETTVLKKATRLDEFERSFKWILGDFYVLCFVDTNSAVIHMKNGKPVEEIKEIIDYKTGALDKESVYKGDNYTQLVIYAAAIEQETGIFPRSAWVELIERTGNPWRSEKLEVGSEIIKIPQDISPERMLKVKKEILKVAREISLHYKVFNKLNNILMSG